MPRRLTKPTAVSEDYKPLIDMLWRFYIAANGPSTRKVAQVIASQDDDVRDGTANHETVRRVLHASYLPEWQTVEVIFLALCQIADIDPNDEDDSDDYGRWDEPHTHLGELRWRYRLARFGTRQLPPRNRQEQARQEARERARRPQDDPWASAPPRPSGEGFSDEPPF